MAAKGRPQKDAREKRRAVPIGPPPADIGLAEEVGSGFLSVADTVGGMAVLGFRILRRLTS